MDFNSLTIREKKIINILNSSLYCLSVMDIYRKYTKKEMGVDIPFSEKKIRELIKSHIKNNPYTQTDFPNYATIKRITEDMFKLGLLNKRTERIGQMKAVYWIKGGKL